MVGNKCVVYSQTYECKGPPQTTHKITGGQTPFCLDGSCRDQGWENNNEMMSSLAQLAVLKEMQGQFELKGGFFKGEANKCSKQPLGFKDCCGSGKGWGKDIGLTSCKAEEKLLNEKRKKAFVIMWAAIVLKKRKLQRFVLRKSIATVAGDQSS